jgi:arylsulfatase A
MAGLSVAANEKPLRQAQDKPNVVFIYGDDVGYGDVGAYGSKLIPTPNIDKLAADGLLFSDGHCSAATCSPSRFSMLTGLYGFRKGVAIIWLNRYF